MRKTILIAICVLALFACKKEVPQGDVVYCVTGDYTNVTEHSVTINCSSVTDKFLNVGERGVWLSTNPDVTQDNCGWYESHDAYSTEKYTVKIESLQAGTTYYYRSYVRIKHEFSRSSYYSGEVKFFTTLPEV